MYQPDSSSKKYLYVFFFTAVLFAYGAYIATRPLVIDAECSEIALQTSGLTKSFRYDPISDYDLNKVNCINEVASKR